MHQVTDNMEFTVRPHDARWEALLTIYDCPRTGKSVLLRAVGCTPDNALAKLWGELRDYQEAR